MRTCAWSPFSPNQENCSPAYCSKDYRPLLRISYLRYNVGSTEMEEPRSWSSRDNYRRRALNRICPSPWHFVTSHKPSLLWTGKGERKSNGHLDAQTTSSRLHLPSYRNESISHFKRRILGIIWGYERSETRLCSTPKLFWIFLFSCLMPSLIPPNECGCRVDQGQNCSMPVNLSLQGRPEIFWYVRSCLVMALPSWPTTTKIHKK